MAWAQFEIWLEHDLTQEEKDTMLNLFDTLFEFANTGCEDLGLHDPHCNINFNAPTPDWVVNARGQASTEDDL